jgi:hypothetical protein
VQIILTSLVRFEREKNSADRAGSMHGRASSTLREPRHHAAEPAADLMARVGGDPADRVVGLDDPQLRVAGPGGVGHGTHSSTYQVVPVRAEVGKYDVV